MIVKDRRPEDHHDADRFALAGAKAEARMAFYLKRAFADAPDVLVLHDLRLPSEDGTDAAQMDHLVIHSGGMVIIESKSVSTEVRINEHKDFARLWDGQWRGFDSPIQQSKLQADFLQKTLAAKAPILRDKALFGLVQKGFGNVPFDILVAISDAGIIERGSNVPEVLKADQIADRVKEIMATRCVSFAVFALKHNPDKDPWASLSVSEMKRIADFLLASHQPLAQKPKAMPMVQQAAVAGPISAPIVASKPVPTPAQAQPLQQATTASKPTCKHCASDKVNVTYGHNYYLKCSACGNNTPIDYTCPKCGKDARIRQEKKITFYRECAGCEHSEVFHVNAHP